MHKRKIVFLVCLLIGIGALFSYKIFNTTSLENQKQENGKKKLAQILKEKYPDIWAKESGNNDHKIFNINNKFSNLITQDVLQEAMKKKNYSLFEHNNDDNPLSYKISGNAESLYISESTTALYYCQTPQAKFSSTIKDQSLDFKILTAVNFGLRGYLFNGYGNLEKEWGNYNTAYISVAYHEKSRLIAWSIPGHKKIILINYDTFKIIKEFNNITSEALAFDSKYLYFFNRVNDKSTLYKVPLNNLESVIPVLVEWDIQYARGLEIDEQKSIAYIADTFNNRLISIDLTTLQIKKEINYPVLKMPNGVFLTNHNTILVADEHNDMIKELNADSFREIRNFPSQYIRSPGDIHEIKKGNYKGSWLIADTDNNRIILVNPKTYELYFEIKNLRGILSLDVIYL